MTDDLAHRFAALFADMLRAARHSYITHARNTGVSVGLIAESSGTSAAMMDRHYLDSLTPDAAKGIAAALGWE